MPPWRIPPRVRPERHTREAHSKKGSHSAKSGAQSTHCRTREVLKKVTELTDWISSEVVVRKGDSKLRLCIDPKDLNKALKRSHYPMPTIEEILPELTKFKAFSVADTSNGFSQVKLDEPNSYLTTSGRCSEGTAG